MTPSLNAIVPMACVTAAGIAAMIAEAFREPGERMPIAGLGVVGLVGAAVATVAALEPQRVELRRRRRRQLRPVRHRHPDRRRPAVAGDLRRRRSSASGCRGGEYYALMLFALAGMMLMATATDLLVIFLALEVLSLAVYVLTGIRRDSPAATEAAFKYFLLGAFSSAFFLYGIAFTYGVTGSTRLDRIGRLMAAQAAAPTPMQLLAVGLLLVGFAFKVSAVPFHMWTPDAYEGAPPAVTGFMSTGVKAAAFAAFVRVFLSAFEPLRGEWSVGRLGHRGGDDDRRHGGRRGAVERQADAGVLEHRARRLSARRAGLGQRRRQGRGAVLPAGLRRHEPRRVRRHRAARQRRAAERSGARLRGPLERASGAGGADDDLPAVARRLPADGRLHREVVRVQRGDQGRAIPGWRSSAC